ncbi:MAG: PQQ-dependent sugar dehydrogenase [Chromatiales bacterium]|nr:PQQ-dependent sugar dehydrogenase [Chromatiales bacterium]
MPITFAATFRRLGWRLALPAAVLFAVPGTSLLAGTFSAGGHDYQVVTVVEGLEHPWGMVFLPGGDMLVTERPGRLRIVREGKLLGNPVSGVPQVLARGQGGLLDVALHPEFASNGLVYLSYARPGEQGATTAVARGRLEGEALLDVEEIFIASAWGRGPVHFGSRLLFDRDGYLFLTIGDRGEMERAQNPGDHAGTTLRLHDDGRVPEDNPFIGREGYLPEIWTMGNRNAQGMALHPETGQVWQNEHGPRGGDELNLILPALNYGWPTITYGINYNGQIISELTEKPGMEQPVVQWTPSIATSGLAIYAGKAFPNWRGDALIGGLAGRQVARVRLDGASGEIREPLLEGYGARIRDVRISPDGLVYLLVDEPNGSMLRLEPVD